MSTSINIFVYLPINLLILVLAANLAISEGNPLFYLIAIITLGNSINYLQKVTKQYFLKNHESKN